MTRTHFALAALLSGFSLFSIASIAEDIPKSEAPKASSEAPHLVPDSTTDGQIEVSGKLIACRATAGSESRSGARRMVEVLAYASTSPT